MTILAYLRSNSEKLLLKKGKLLRIFKVYSMLNEVKLVSDLLLWPPFQLALFSGLFNGLVRSLCLDPSRSIYEIPMMESPEDGFGSDVLA